jgi:hypothetical protein
MPSVLSCRNVDVFECFDGYWQENFGSAVLVMSFRLSQTFRSGLLKLIRMRCKREVVARAARDTGTYVATREQGFCAYRGREKRRGRYDILLVSGTSAIAIENKVRLSTTREQIGSQRQSLEQRFTNVLVCSLNRYQAAVKNEDVALSWSDIGGLVRRLPSKEITEIGGAMALAVHDYFGGHDVEFKGFSRRDQPFRTHHQRRLLLEALIRRIAKGEPRWYDNRNHEGEYHYQSAGFTDLYGGRGRYLGFYDYAKGDRSALELYSGDGEDKLVAKVPWSELRQELASSRKSLERAVERIASRFCRVLKPLAPPSRRKAA